MSDDASVRVQQVRECLDAQICMRFQEQERRQTGEESTSIADTPINIPVKSVLREDGKRKISTKEAMVRLSKIDRTMIQQGESK